MRKKTPTQEFITSAEMNVRTYRQYYDRLMEIAISTFEYANLPDTIDARFLEYTLFTDGQALFFKDEELGFLGLQCTIGGTLDVYRIPIIRYAYSTNGYRTERNKTNSVIIYNNQIRTNSINAVEMYAMRLYELDRTIDVNVKAQKTPVLVECESDKQRLTMKNLYMQYDGNQPFIYGHSGIDIKSGNLSVLKTDAPYISDKLYELKKNIWNEALTYLGVPNVAEQKKERLVTDEVTRGMGGVIASRFSRLEARQYAVEQINRMFGLEISVKYKDTTTVDSSTKSGVQDIE